MDVQLFIRYYRMKHLALALAIGLPACGTDTTTEKSGETTALVGSISTVLRGYSRITNATSTCTDATCTSTFTAGTSNCSLAKAALVRVANQVAFVQRLDDLFVRQREPHTWTFTGQPTEHEAVGWADGIDVYFYCRGQNG